MLTTQTQSLDKSAQHDDVSQKMRFDWSTNSSSVLTCKILKNPHSIYFGCTALLGSTQYVPARSCRQIKNIGDSTGDGNYWLDLKGSGNSLQFNCLMSSGERSYGGSSIRPYESLPNTRRIGANILLYRFFGFGLT